MLWFAERTYRFEVRNNFLSKIVSYVLYVICRDKPVTRAKYAFKNRLKYKNVGKTFAVFDDGDYAPVSTDS